MFELRLKPKEEFLAEVVKAAEEKLGCKIKVMTEEQQQALDSARASEGEPE